MRKSPKIDNPSPLERNLRHSSQQCNRIGEEVNFKSVREKCGYLVPLSVGGKKRYRLSDIQRLLNR